MVQNMYFRTNADNMQANLTNQLLEVSDTSQQGQADCYLSFSDSLYGIQAEIYAIAKNLPSTGTVNLLVASFIYKNNWTSAGDFRLDYDCDTNEFVATFNKQTSSETETETTTNRYTVSDVITANREFEIYLTFMDNNGYFDINGELDKPIAYSFDSPVYISLIQLRSNTQSEELVYRLNSSFEFEGESPASFTLLDMFPPVMSGSTNSKFLPASEPVLETTDAYPSTEYYNIDPSTGVDGFSQVHVYPVDSTIDSNIQASNIKSGVSILGVAGNVIERNAQSKTASISAVNSLPVDFNPDSGYNCLAGLQITNIENLEASNIKQGVTIAGVTGSAALIIGQDKREDLVQDDTLPYVFEPDDGLGYNCLNSVTLTDIENLEAANIKSGVKIAGVTGTYSGSTPTLVTKTITQNGTYSASSDSADGYSEVTVNVSGSKFGVSIDNFIGNVDSNGVLSSPSSINGITFTGVTEIAPTALRFFADYSQNIYGVISFPALTTVGYEGLMSAFKNNSITSVDLSALTTVGDSGLNEAFCDNRITSVDLSSLTTVGNSGLGTAFYNNQITSIDLSSLTTIGDNGLQSAFSSNQITSVDLSNLTTVSNSGLNSAFNSNQITSVDLSSLTTISNSGLASAFSDNRLVNINFPNLEHLDNYALANAFAYNGILDDETGLLEPSLQSVSFPALTSQSFIGLEEGYREYFSQMLADGDSVTVHFPSNLQSVIGDWDDVTNGFGGTNTTVLFDLPSTNEPGGDVGDE